MIGGTNAEVSFSGLAPGFVGLLQANIRIPNVAAGDRRLVVTIGGAASPSAKCPDAPARRERKKFIAGIAGIGAEAEEAEKAELAGSVPGG